ncbi:MAG: methylmalonyl-CoA mutase subunit beta [Bacteroidota bacterium]
MNNFTIHEFEAIGSRQWKQKIQVDLKGADYNETLVWQSLEGIHVKPFYHRDEMHPEPLPVPGHPGQWRITQAIFIDDDAVANNLAIDAIERGAEAISFAASRTFDPAVVFANLPLESVAIYFQLEFLDRAFLTSLIEFLSAAKADAYFNIDILGNLARTGNWFVNLKSDHEDLEALLRAYPSQPILGVNVSHYQNAGANSVQQLAYALGHANEYLNHFPKEVLKESPMCFTVAVGSNYFFEIAKIRALRMLYATLAKAYGVKGTCHISAVPTRRNKTLYDYNCNMLRTTTECMSAVLGGADSICNIPYDGIYHKSNAFGERISRNQLLILKSESYFDQVSNPADGSYYIESLTRELANKALELFKEIERSGGFYAQLSAGTIQKKIKESANKEQELFDNGALVLVGTNKYPNPEDRMKHDLELYPFVKKNPRKTLIEPIIAKRLAEGAEQKRLDDE